MDRIDQRDTGLDDRTWRTTSFVGRWQCRQVQSFYTIHTIISIVKLTQHMRRILFIHYKLSTPPSNIQKTDVTNAVSILIPSIPVPSFFSSFCRWIRKNGRSDACFPPLPTAWKDTFKRDPFMLVTRFGRVPAFGDGFIDTGYNRFPDFGGYSRKTHCELSGYNRRL